MVIYNKKTTFMKHLRIFESFINEAQMMEPGPGEGFDPVKFKVAAEMLATKIGEKEDKANLGFPEIREVFGKDDYNLRFCIAQALMNLGRNYFTTNKYHTKNVQDVDKKKGFGMWTYYIGEADQNMKMKKLGKALLVTIKPLVLQIEKVMKQPLGQGQLMKEKPFFNWESPQTSEVTKIKSLVDKLPKTEFPI